MPKVHTPVHMNVLQAFNGHSCSSGVVVMRKRKRGRTGWRRLNALALLRDYWFGVACVVCAIGVCQCHCHETE
jgi:hypothetical protein